MKKEQPQVNVGKNSSQLAKVKKVRMSNKTPVEQNFINSARCN